VDSRRDGEILDPTVEFGEGAVHRCPVTTAARRKKQRPAVAAVMAAAVQIFMSCPSAIASWFIETTRILSCLLSPPEASFGEPYTLAYVRLAADV